MAHPEDTGIDRLSLRASRRRDGFVDIHVRKLRVGTLSAASVAMLDIRDGAPWTPELAGAVEHRARCEAAHRAASSALARRPLTTHEVRRRLAAKSFDRAVVDEVIGVLTRQGLVDDADTARRVARHGAERGTGRALVESKLAAKGVDADTARSAIEEEPGADIHAVAQRKLRTIPESLGAEARARRLFGFLARRGFDEQECAEAVRRLLDIDTD